MNVTGPIFIRCVNDVQQTRSDILEMHVGLVLHALPAQNSFDMGQDGLETSLTHDFDDLLADQLVGAVTDHSRVRFTHENITQIGTATCEQKRRIG